MAQPARLITPDGKAIELPAEVYRQVKRLLDTRGHRQSARSRARIDSAIQASYGMLAGPVSLTQALLEERAAERAREEAKLSHWKD